MRQGIPDDLKRSEDVPLDVVGALEVLYRRMCTLDDESAPARTALLDLRDAVKRDERG